MREERAADGRALRQPGRQATRGPAAPHGPRSLHRRSAPARPARGEVLAQRARPRSHRRDRCAGGAEPTGRRNRGHRRRSRDDAGHPGHDERCRLPGDGLASAGARQGPLRRRAGGGRGRGRRVPGRRRARCDPPDLRAAARRRRRPIRARPGRPPRPRGAAGQRALPDSLRERRRRARSGRRRHSPGRDLPPRPLLVLADGAARRDGAIVALKSTLTCASGAYSVYPVTASLEPLTAAGILPGPYKIGALAYEAYAAATNKCPAGAYRGVGMALGTFVRERVVDMVARRAGLDPADVRRRNLIDAAELPFATASGLVIDSGDPKESRERALAAGDYPKLRAAPRRSASGKYRGVGLGAYTEFTGMGSGTFRRRGMVQVPGHDAATVRVEPTGEARGFVSAASQGQGHATTLAQILADELGVDLAAVTIVEGDTERCPYGSGSFASRSMVVSGGALVLAARRVREKIGKIAGHMLEAAPEDLTIEGGRIAVRGAPGRTLTVADVARLAYRPAGGTLPPGVDPALEATQYYDPPPAT